MARISRKPITKEFKITADPEGKATVIIRQARNIDTERRGELFATTVAEIEGRATTALRQHWNIHEQRRIEAGLVVLAITGVEMADGPELDAKSASLFKTKDTPDGVRLDMSLGDFYEAWGQLEDDYVREIHGYIMVMNPQWNPNQAGE